MKTDVTEDEISDLDGDDTLNLLAPVKAGVMEDEISDSATFVHVTSFKTNGTEDDISDLTGDDHALDLYDLDKSMETDNTEDHLNLSERERGVSQIFQDQTDSSTFELENHNEAYQDHEIRYSVEEVHEISSNVSEYEHEEEEEVSLFVDNNTDSSIIEQKRHKEQEDHQKHEIQGHIEDEHVISSNISHTEDKEEQEDIQEEEQEQYDEEQQKQQRQPQERPIISKFQEDNVPTDNKDDEKNLNMKSKLGIQQQAEEKDDEENQQQSDYSSELQKKVVFSPSDEESSGDNDSVSRYVSPDEHKHRESKLRHSSSGRFFKIMETVFFFCLVFFFDQYFSFRKYKLIFFESKARIYR